MKIIVDAQLPPALARFLAELGEDALHVMDVQMEASPDNEIWRLALQQNAVIISKDEDFSVRASVSTHTPQIVWLRIGNCSRKTLLTIFENKWPQIKKALSTGENLIEVIGEH